MKKRELQLILDRETAGRNIDTVRIAKEAIAGGARWIQLRDKMSDDGTLLREALKLRELTTETGAILIINDRVDIAMASGADGVHIGQEDLPYECARRLLGADKIIGISTHNIEQARAAQVKGADYIGVGPIFKTRTKPALKAIGLDIIDMVSREIRIPAFFIGGIDLRNLDEVLNMGAGSIAVASAILQSNNITESTRSYVNKLREAEGMLTR
ncbi:MAG: thiamine phosphate synthase [Candidatus Omnitrophota bacterium]